MHLNSLFFPNDSTTKVPLTFFEVSILTCVNSDISSPLLGVGSDRQQGVAGVPGSAHVDVPRATSAVDRTVEVQRHSTISSRKKIVLKSQSVIFMV